MYEALKPVTWKTKFGTAVTVTTDEHWEEVSRILIQEPVVLLDTETTDLMPDRRLRLIQIATPNPNDLVYGINPQENPDIVDWVQNSPATFVCFNAAFDLMTISITANRDPYEYYDWMINKAMSNQVHCVMVHDQVRHSRGFSRSLSACAKEQGVHNKYEDKWNDYAKRIGLTDDNKYEAASLNDKHYLQYSLHDIFQLRAVYNNQSMPKTTKLKKLLRIEQQIHILYSVLQHQGLKLDYEKAESLMEDLYKVREKGRKLLSTVGINKEGSTKQVAEALLTAGARLTKRTEGGVFSTSKDALEAIEKPDKARKIAKLVLKTRSASKDMSMVNNFSTNAYGDYVHPNLRSIGAVTIRSACDTPNLQQVNKHQGNTRMRGLITVEPGLVIASADYRNMEVGTIADQTGDKKLIKRYVERFDIHGDLARQIYGNNYKDIERHYAKQGVFAMIFGAGPAKMAEAAKCSVAEATAIKKAWRKTYPVCANVSDGWMHQVDSKGYFTTDFGWRPNVGKTKNGQTAKYRAVSYNVQGKAAFILKYSAVQIAREGLWTYVRMVVHDEFVNAIPEHEVEDVLPRIMKAMEYKGKYLTLETEGTIHGSHWGTA